MDRDEEERDMEDMEDASPSLPTLKWKCLFLFQALFLCSAGDWTRGCGCVDILSLVAAADGLLNDEGGMLAVTDTCSLLVWDGDLDAWIGGGVGISVDGVYGRMKVSFCY